MEARSREISAALVCLLLVAGAVFLTWLLGHASISSDEWGLVVRAQDGNIHGIFDPWNGHLLAVGQIIAYVSIQLFGSDFSFLIALDIAGILACSLLIYLFAARRLGPIVALVPALVPIFFSGASTFYGTGLQFTPLMGINGIWSLDFGLAALLLLERERRAQDIAAAAMLGLSLASFSYGLAFVVGTAVAVALGPDRWKRAYVVVVPIGLYIGWRLWASTFTDPSAGSITAEHLLLSPLYMGDSLAAVGAGYFGLAPIVGRGPSMELSQNHIFNNISLPFLLIAVEATVIVLVARALGRRGLTRSSLWPSLATLIAMWGSQAAVFDTISRMPGDPRYLFAGAVMVAVVASELARDVKLSRFAVVLVLAVAAVGVLANIPRFREGKATIELVRERNEITGAMFQLAGANADPTFQPAIDLPDVGGSIWIDVRGFRAFKEKHGTLASMPIDKVPELSPEQREDADQLLAGALRLRLEATTRRSDPPCTVLDPDGVTPLPPGVAILKSPGTDVGLRRFGDRAAVSLGEVQAHSPERLVIPRSPLTDVPWRLVNEGDAPLAVCRAR
jgi:hypothetical protein